MLHRQLVRTFSVAALSLLASARLCATQGPDDTLPEGTSATVLQLNAPFSLRELDTGQGTAPDPFVVDDAAGSELRFERGFFGQVISFGAHVPGPQVELRRCRSFTLQVLPAQPVVVLRMWVSRAQAGNSIAYDLRAGATSVGGGSVGILAGTAPFDLVIRAQSATPFDRIVISGSGPIDGGAFHGVFGSAIAAAVDFAPTCSGSGTIATPCPCGNSTSAIDPEGCSSSLGSGARLRMAGFASLANDSVELLCTQLPNTTALILQGSVYLPGGTPLGDGVGCLGGSVVRIATRVAAGSIAHYPLPGEPSLSVRGGITAPGSAFYQVWHRNAASFCTAATFNVSDGLALTWFP